MRKNNLYKGIRSGVRKCHNASIKAGWYHNLRTGKQKRRNPGEMIALIHSEVSEMLEGVRKDQMDDKLRHRRMEEVEAADILIRLFDYAGYRKLDLAGAMIEKLAYNAKRADHKIKNRRRVGGKRF